MYNCICILPFLWLADTSFSNFASTSHVFYALRILSCKITHLQSPKIHYCRYCHSISFKLLFNSGHPTSKKKTMHSCSASSGKPDSNSLDCIVFSFLEGIVIEIGGAMKDLLFWCLMYLHPGFICCRRCSFDN